MLIYSCRDLQNGSKLCKGRGQWGVMEPDHTFQQLPILPKAPLNGHALVLVHGFNTSQNTLSKAYHQLRTTFGALWPNGIGSIYGFSWPAQSAPMPWYYIWARDHSDEAGIHLSDMVIQLRSMGYSKISFVCHSMGSIVVMEMLRDIPQSMCYRVAIHGGDADLKDFRRKKWFGNQCAVKIDLLLSYYSGGDQTLSIFARIMHGEIRVGERAFPADCPSNYRSIDAQMLERGEVDHDTYKDSPAILLNTIAELKKSD